MSSRPNVAAVVLAAGGSTRLGQPKQLLNLDGYPLLSRTLDLVRASQLSPRIIVLGGYADEVRARVPLDGFTIVENTDYQQGQSTSLIAGLKALPPDVAGVVVVLGDQPLLPPGLLDKLVNHFDPETVVAVRPRYAEGPGNPVLLSRVLFPELLELEGDVGARDVLRRHRGRIAEVDVSGWPTPRDVDTLEDYRSLLEDWASLGAPDVPGICQRCGAEMATRRIDERLRPACPRCNFTAFYDPKISVATIIEIDGRIIMQRRAHDPGRGLWTFPSGFVDRGEPLRLAAAREVREEVGVVVDDLELLDIYSEPGKTVVLVVFTASAEGQAPALSDETLEVALVDPDNLPELAFPRDSEIIAEWKRRRKSG